MDITFASRKLEKVFNDEQSLVREFGKEMAEAIKRRMPVLQGADSLADVPHTKPERRHELTANRKDEFAVDLKHPHRLVFRPNHDPVPRSADGGIALSQVTAIIILSVEDYHK